MNTKHEPRLEIRAQREPFIRDTISLRFVRRSDSGRIAIAREVVFEDCKPEEWMCEIPRAMEIAPDEAQQFVDELWRVGIRPTEGTGSSGMLGATQRHLEDMRSIAFAKTGVQKP